MSLNLICWNKHTKEEVSLWQTPTEKTRQIFSFGVGGTPSILSRYEGWIHSRANDPKLSEYVRKQIVEENTQHIAELKNKLTPLTDFEFGIN